MKPSAMVQVVSMCARLRITLLGYNQGNPVWIDILRLDQGYISKTIQNEILDLATDQIL